MTGNSATIRYFLTPSSLRRLVAAVIASVALMSSYSYAHHSFSGSFDLSKKVEIAGTLKSFEFRNPHIQAVLEVADSNGDLIAWEIESMNPRRWDGAGVPRDIMSVGDSVKILGWQGHGGAQTLLMGTVTNGENVIVVRDEIRQGQREDR